MSFETLAPHYTWMETVLAGRRLQRARTAWLEALAEPKDILIAGVGHGHFLRRAALRFPQARILCIDASPGMLRRAESRVRRAGANMERLSFAQAVFPDWRPTPGRFDVVVTHFFLDCFPPDELAAVVETLAQSTQPESRWLIADFALPKSGWPRRRAMAVQTLMYAFFRRVTKIRARRLTPPDPLLAAHGFELAGRSTFEWGLLHSDLWARTTPTGGKANRGFSVPAGALEECESRFRVLVSAEGP